MIIGLYLFFPVIGRWIRSASQTEIIYFICIWIATLFISMPLVSGYFPDFNLKYFTGYIGYAVLGYYLFYYQHTNSKKIKALSILMIIAGIAITYYGTYYVTLSNKELSQFYYGYLTPNVLLISVGVVILFKDVAFNFSARTNQIIGFFSKYSYGIYLAHLMVLWQLQALGLDVTLKRPVIGIPLTGILCMCISSVIVWLIHKLPYGKHVSG
jgi:surface polysaccharide O-acyltransferase-like enzyme